ncbi:Ig-like domain-containing protein, partial [Pseudoalteromonas sp. C8]|uniref:Ig-like domain-containing protein n=1 Tax=Pseudoalteromonas sp. C8 TaxID=2686345 RepID=UPI001F1108F8
SKIAQQVTYDTTAAAISEDQTITISATSEQGLSDSDSIIIEVNAAPIANDDGPVIVTEDIPSTGNVLGNDTDIEGDPLTVVQFIIDGNATVHSAG